MNGIPGDCRTFCALGPLRQMEEEAMGCQEQLGGVASDSTERAQQYLLIH